MLTAKGRVRLYLDKAGQDGGVLVPQILELAKKLDPAPFRLRAGGWLESDESSRRSIGHRDAFLQRG